MTKFQDTITKSGREVSLSHDERAKMTRVVREYMAMKPLPYAETYSVSVSYSFFSFAHHPIAAALVLVMIFGSGVSYAAEGALPGDALYAIKTAINEPTRLALATNAEAKAEIQIEYAERRIEEAAALAAEGRLDDSTQEELAIAFESHAVAAAEHMTEAEADDSSASIALASRFETRLLAHENVLAEVESSDDEPHSARLVDAIRIASANVVSIRATNALALNIGAPAAIAADASLAADTEMPLQVEPMMMTMIAADEPLPEDTVRSAKSAGAPEMAAFSATANASAPDAKTISRMQNGAEKSLKTAQKNLKNAKSLSAEARAKAEADISFAAQLITDGKNFLASDVDAEAFASFEESLRVSEQASVYIKAAPTLEKARARSATSSSSRGTIQNRIDTRLNVTVPAASVNATITLPVSDSSMDDAEDNHDRIEDESGDADDQKKEEDSPTLRLLNKFNISL